MANTQFLSSKTLAKLRAIYDDLPEHPKLTESSSQVDSLKKFMEASGQKVELLSGEILFRQNDPGDGMYWIESGLLVVFQGKLEEPRLLTFRYPGQVVGEIALLENTQRSASVAAIVTTQLRYLSKEKFQGLLELIPGFGVEIMRLLSARLREVKPAEYSAGLYDHLTGALSRRAFDTRLREELERARLYKYNLSLVFLDLDYFKEVNDTYGHARGDEVLRSFVEQVKANLRTTDLLFRFGGDEFVLILQGVDQSRGPALVQHLLDDISAMQFPGKPPLTITFSAGLAYFPTDGDTAKTLLETADQRMYLAKRGGRGRVTDSSSGIWEGNS
ncbi:MAG: GGDEF domain-containing protein [Anaerolineales bacterium]|jgi:diguanylate cyclase (GGDEF)-like protein